MPAPKTSAQIKRLPPDKLRNEYDDLAEEFNKIISNETIYCAKCGAYHTADAFYASEEFKAGVFPICKDCLADMATDYDKRRDANIDNRDKMMRVFHMLNIPYSDEAYKTFKDKSGDDVGVARVMMDQIMAWAMANKKSWSDSVFEGASVMKEADARVARDDIRRVFGRGLSEDDYLFLQDQYDDWKARTQVDSKSQETYVQQICMQLLDIDKDRKSGKDATNKIQALDKLMCSANLQPKQNVGNAATDSLTFGQLIEKWEQEKPISEPSAEFKDVDRIAKYIRVWFTGWLCKALGLKANVFTTEFDKEIGEYEVKRREYDEDDETSNIYAEIFGDENGG